MKDFFVMVACLFSLQEFAAAADADEDKGADAEGLMVDKVVSQVAPDEALDGSAVYAAAFRDISVDWYVEELKAAAKKSVVVQQAEIKTKVENAYMLPLMAETNDTVRYLWFLTRVQFHVVVPGAADGVIREVQAILRGALGGLPNLEDPSLNPIDRETIIKAFLMTQIVQDTDTTLWWHGAANAKEDPRYEAWEACLREAMAHVIPPAQQQSQEQLAILNAIALATREKLWNPKSTLHDLQAHVRNFWLWTSTREYLGQVDHIVGQYINADLMRWIDELESKFPVRNEEKQRLREFLRQRPSMVITQVNNPQLNDFLRVGDVLAHFPSYGYEEQCGFFSLGFHDDRDKGGPSARQAFFESVSNNLGNPLIAKMFVDKYIDHNKTIESTLTMAWDAYSKGLPPPHQVLVLGDFESLLPYESLLKEKGAKEDQDMYITGKQNINNYIVTIIEDYIRHRQRKGKTLSEVNIYAAARIKAEIAGLVRCLFMVLGAEPFGEAIKAMQCGFVESRFGGVADAELTLRQNGTVVTPFRPDYHYSDPVDVLVSANQNIFGWVREGMFKNGFYGVRGTITEIKQLARKLVSRLNIDQSNVDGVLDQSVKHADEMRQIQAIPKEERIRLSNQLNDTVLRMTADGKDADSDLDRAFPEIMSAGGAERAQMVEGINWNAILEAAEAAQYPLGVDPEQDKGSAVYLINRAKGDLLNRPAPLAIAEADGHKLYLMDAILATDAGGNNTARNTHLINFGAHYERLIPVSDAADASLTSVAKVKRHMEKYGLDKPRSDQNSKTSHANDDNKPMEDDEARVVVDREALAAALDAKDGEDNDELAAAIKLSLGVQDQAVAPQYPAAVGQYPAVAGQDQTLMAQYQSLMAQYQELSLGGDPYSALSGFMD